MRESWLNAAFGAEIRDRRKRHGMSQDELAQAADISRTSIVNIENGRQGVSLATLYRLADALACSPGDLLPAREELKMPRIAIGDESDSSRQAILRVLRRVTTDR